MTEEQAYFRRSTIIMLGAAIGGFAIEYALNLFLARTLTSPDYGDFKVAMAFLAIASMAVVVGGDRAAPRFLPAFLETDHRGGVWDYVRTFLLVAFALSAGVAAVTIMLSLLIYGGLDPQDHHPLVVASLVAPFAAVVTLLGRVFLAAKLVGLSQLPWRIVYPLLLLVLVSIAAFLFDELTGVDVLWIVMIVALIVIVIQLFFLFRHQLMPLRRHPDIAVPKQWIVASVPMMLVGLLQIGMSQTDIFMVELLSDSEAVVGYFGAATTTVYVIVLAQTVGVSVISPLVTGALAEGGDAVRRLQERGFRLLFWLVAPLCAGIVVFAPFIMSLFGVCYVEATAALQILTIGYGVSSVLALSPLWLQFAGKERATMWVTLAVFLANIPLNAVMVPLYDIDGAAISTTVSLFVAAVVLSVLMRRDINASPWPVGSAITGLVIRNAR
ncbi:MAG: flippase [Pseudomonadota bacterium]